MIDWTSKNIDIGRYADRHTGYVKVHCPECDGGKHGKSDKSLSCNLETGAFKCHRCGFQGFATVTTDEEKDAWMRQQPWFREYMKKKDEPKHVYSKPPKQNAFNLHPSVVEYFSKRGISEKTLREMRVSSGTDWMPAGKENRLPDGGKCTTIHFNYFKNGELVATKLRAGDKVFRQAKSGCEQVAYNLDNIKNCEDCYIVEGEIDALSLIEIGYRNVISVPDGGSDKAMHWLADYYETHFSDKKTIYICVDNDDVGNGLCDELCKHFDPGAYVIISDLGTDPEDGHRIKDANECLVTLGAEVLRKKLSEGRTVRPDGDADMENLGNDLDELYRNGMPKGINIGFPNLDEYMRIEKGRLVIITGTPGSGKSQFIDQIAEKLATSKNWRFSMFSPEMMPLSLHMAMLVSKFTGKPFNNSELSFDQYTRAKEKIIEHFHFINPDSYDLDQILSIAKYQVRKYGCDALVIDPWNDLTLNGEGISKTDEINSALLKILTFAQRQNVVVFVMAHPAKISRTKDGQTPEPTLSDISGSIHFYNRADIGIVVVRVTEDGREYTKVKISKMRFANLGKTGEVYFKYGVGVGRFHPFDPATEITSWDHKDHLDINTEQLDIEPIQYKTSESNINGFIYQAERQQHEYNTLQENEELFSNNDQIEPF